MCGIAGFIGNSKKQKISYELITAMVSCLEIRGLDATGFWATEESDKDYKGGIYYYKQAIKSSLFVRNPMWQSINNKKINMMVAHARATSKEGGNPDNNVNNHPFVSADREIALVHNGNIDEISCLKKKYQTISETDSEVLLRIFEHGLSKDYFGIDGVPDQICQKIMGIKDIWSYISRGAMAVAIGERVDDYTRELWLFRNEKRPLWLADLRSQLGQVFFFSSPDIWYSAMESNPELKELCWATQKIIELPQAQVWHMRIDKDNKIVNKGNFHKMAIEITETNKEFDAEEHNQVIFRKPKCTVFSNQPLETPLVIIPKKEEQKIQYICEKPLYKRPVYENDNEDFSPKNAHESICDDIKKITDKIYVETTNLSIEASISASDYYMVVESLQQIKTDLEGTLSLLNRS